VERSPANAAIARRIWAHAGVTDRVTCVVGTIDDGGNTLDLLAKCGFDCGELDFLFLDHHKDAYLPDLCSIVDRGWLHTGSVVLADNVRFPGSPVYRAYMREQQGIEWFTTEHQAHVEYQTMVGDLVLESEALDPSVAR
jgi:catechol O-methyltransferase